MMRDKLRAEGNLVQAVPSLTEESRGVPSRQAEPGTSDKVCQQPWTWRGDETCQGFSQGVPSGGKEKGLDPGLEASHSVCLRGPYRRQANYSAGLRFTEEEGLETRGKQGSPGSLVRTIKDY